MLPIRSPSRNTSQTQNSSSIQQVSNDDANSNTTQQNQTPQTENPLLTGCFTQSNYDLCATSVKLPQFWTNCPDAWFIHAEMQFTTKGISLDRTKYEYIITALPQEVIITVLDIIQNPPPNNLYHNLKKVLVERHSLSETSRLEKILSDSEMGNRKPSEFYRSLSLLAGTSFSPDILKKLWLRKLPKSLNVALTGSNHNDINEMIQLADKIWEVMFNGEVANIKEHNPTNIEYVVENLTKTLCENMTKLCVEINSLKQEFNDRQPRSSYRNRYRRNSRSRVRSSSRDWLCRYHYRFGDKAIRCEQPCSYKQNSSN
ncbi:uncharacterized protein LOC119616058 [Lucilia sericata]|uniref:uncharacterized protein LOC119616058 n=1 Tax=Lucilia sericata TaxID=13632 RepID=UPI0018A87EE6|nr:uncharacterized protein LOC119616058 [Lucilia sericata]